MIATVSLPKAAAIAAVLEVLDELARAEADTAGGDPRLSEAALFVFAEVARQPAWLDRFPRLRAYLLNNDIRNNG